MRFLMIEDAKRVIRSNLRFKRKPVGTWFFIEPKKTVNPNTVDNICTQTQELE